MTNHFNSARMKQNSCKETNMSGLLLFFMVVINDLKRTLGENSQYSHRPLDVYF
jgi:hypothetical protein